MRKVVLLGALLIAAPAFGQWFEDFEGAFPPAGWTLADYLPGSAFQWTDVDWAPRGNLTGGTGKFAIGDSDYFSGAFDIGMITPLFVVPGGAKLEFDTEYQNFAAYDTADVDIDVGAGWVNLLHWKEDHPGPLHMSLDISAYAGQSAQVRFHYFDTDPGAWDWWWEVDNVAVTPEPSSLGLLALGALALLRRR